MAIIPLSPGGVIAQPGPMRQAPREAFGGNVADVVTGIGQMGQRAALDMRQEELREQAELRKKEAEARAAADHAKRVTVVAQVEDGLADLHDSYGEQVRNGERDRTKAEEQFRADAAKIVEQAQRDMPADENAPVVMAQLQRRAERLTNGVRRAVVDRDRREVTAAIGTTLEHAERLYAKDPQKASVMAQGVVEQLGPHSTLQPEQLQKALQGWRERTQFNAVDAMISRGKNDRKALAEAEKAMAAMSDLDPSARTRLEGRIDLFRGKLDREAEMAAARAERAAAAQLRKAEAAFTSASALADEGALDPAYADAQLRAMAGTPYAAAFKQVLARQAENGTIAARSPTEVRAAVDQLNARMATSATPELKKQRDRLERIADGQTAAIKQDGMLRAAVRYGVVTEPPTPLDMRGGLQGIAQQLAARVPAATAAAQWADPKGKAVELLYPDEAMRVKEMVEVLPVKERAAALQVLSKTMGPQASAGLAKQIERLTAGTNLAERATGYALAMGEGRMTDGRLRSEYVLRGAEAIRSGASTKVEAPAFGVKPSAWASTIDAQLEGFPNEATRRQFGEAALLVAHGISAEQGGKLDKDDLERAVRMAVGGPMVARGVQVVRDGKRQPALIPLPAGLDESAIDKTIDRMTPADIGADALIVGGQPMPAAEFLKRVLPNAPLAPVTPGVFAPMVGERSVLRPDGSRFTFTVR